MKKYGGVLLCFLMVFTGCRRSSPDLRMQENHEINLEKTSGQTARDLVNSAQVVTAEPALVDEKKEGDVQTAKDKTGAVAVKVRY